ncbi:MAG TPA: hypothetical protein VD999_02580 [Vitreimonas sp.]|nr:hypothetical protein [Vitreimonas sp.]
MQEKLLPSTNIEKSWQETLKSDEFLPAERELLTLLYDEVINGEPELRIYTYDVFIDKCRYLNIDPIVIQEKAMRLFPQYEIQALFKHLPKGLKIRAKEELYHDGTSIAGTMFFIRELNESNRLYQRDGKDFVKLSRAEVKKIIETELPNNKPTFINETLGWVTAESIQGYSNGVRLSQIDGEETDVSIDDTTFFIIEGADHKLAQRRPREIYFGQSVQVWDADIQRWVRGRITDRKNVDKILVQLDEPIEKTNYFGEPSQVKDAEIWIGDVAIRGWSADKKLPSLGSSMFEREEYHFLNIDLTAEQEKVPFEQIPKEFIPGTLIRFPGGGIGLVERTNSQGQSFVDGVKAGGQPSLEGESVNWMNLEQLPIILESTEFEKENSELRNRRVKINIRSLEGEEKLSFRQRFITRLRNKFMGLFSEKQNKNQRIMKVEKLVKLNNEPYVILRSLPVLLSEGGNKNQRLYYELPLRVFNELIVKGECELSSKDVTESLRYYFPDQYKDIINNIDNYFGSVYAEVKLKNNRVILKKQSVYFNCLPFGVYLIFPNEDIPRLIPLEKIESIEIL